MLTKKQQWIRSAKAAPFPQSQRNSTPERSSRDEANSNSASTPNRTQETMDDSRSRRGERRAPLTRGSRSYSDSSLNPDGSSFEMPVSRRSTSDSDLCRPEKKKRVQFSTVVRVALIPSAREMDKGIRETMWWGEKDFCLFRKNGMVVESEPIDPVCKSETVNERNANVSVC